MKMGGMWIMNRLQYLRYGIFFNRKVLTFFRQFVIFCVLVPKLYRMLWGQTSEVQATARYFFDNAQRGGSAEILCLQRTRAGRAFFQWEGGRQYVPQGWGMLFSHNEASAYGYPPEDGEPYVHDFITFEGPDAVALMHRIREQGGAIPMPKGSESARLFAECLRRFLERGFRDRYHESAAIYELLMALLGQALTAHLDRDPLQAAHEFIRRGFNSPITVADVATASGLSREHLSRTYTARYGTSPGRALRQLRIRSACELLTNTHASVEQIAIRCGYRDPDAFTRAFAQDTGLNPLAYRKR